jgi:hypothetical protein
MCELALIRRRKDAFACRLTTVRIQTLTVIINTHHVNGSREYNVTRQQSKRNPLLHFLGNNEHLYIQPKLYNNVSINVTFRHVSVIIVAMENKYYIFCVCVCSLNFPACNAHAPYYIVIRDLLLFMYGPPGIIANKFAAKSVHP